MTTLLLTFAILFTAIIAMAVGVLWHKDKNKWQLRGSCGGPKTNPNCCMKKDCPKKNGA